MKKLKHFLFYQQFPEISINKFFFVDVTDIKSKEELLYSYYQAFNFPSYFGFNWDALYDALCHLDKWLEEKKIFIIHKDLSCLGKDDFKIYISVLSDVCNFWKQYPDSLELKVYFPELDKNKIQQILSR